MFFKKRDYKINFKLLIIFILVISFVSSSDSYRLYAGGGEVLINEHATSRYVSLTCAPDVFVPTKTSLEWQRFREYLPPCVFLRTYNPWQIYDAKRCLRRRYVTTWSNINGVVTSSSDWQWEYARTDSTYARWNSDAVTKTTGNGARWTSCRRCGWLKSLWCCDYEYCAINSFATGSCTSGDNGSCCNWQASCDSCRNICENSYEECSSNDRC